MNKSILQINERVTVKSDCDFLYGGKPEVNQHFKTEPKVGTVVSVHSYIESSNCFKIDVQWDKNSAGDSLYNFLMLENEFIEYYELKHELREGDIVELKNPRSSNFYYGGKMIVENAHVATGLPPEKWRAVIQSIQSEYVILNFCQTEVTGLKLLKTEIKKNSSIVITADLSGSTSFYSGNNNVTLGNQHVAIGNGTTDIASPGKSLSEFSARPSGYVETHNDDVPLFKQVKLRPNKIPEDFE